MTDGFYKSICLFVIICIAFTPINIEVAVLHDLNPNIELTSRLIKRRFVKSTGFQSLRHASLTIKGMETVYVLYKQNRNLRQGFGFSTYDELRSLLTIHLDLLCLLEDFAIEPYIM